jgi:hypothetical protein
MSKVKVNRFQKFYQQAIVGLQYILGRRRKDEQEWDTLVRIQLSSKIQERKCPFPHERHNARHAVQAIPHALH